MSLRPLCGFLLLTSSAFGQGPFQVTLREGTVPARTLHLDETGLRLDDNKRVPLSEVVSIRQAREPMPARLQRGCLMLPLGDRWKVALDKPVRIEEDTFYFSPDFGEETGISLAYVSALLLNSPPGSPEKFLEKIWQGSGPLDRVWLQGGNLFAGTIVALDTEKGLRLQSSGREQSWPVAKLAGLAFNTELRAKPRLRGPYWHAVLADGSRLSLNQLQCDGIKLSAKSLFGPRISFDLNLVRALDVHRGCADYLSDLTPATVETVPFLGTSWPMQRDATPAGLPISLGLNTFDKGLGLHSQSTVVYDLADHFRFEAIVGLDPVLGRKGQVRLQILLDDKISWARSLTFADGPVPVEVDVRHGKKLTLSVMFGDLGDVQGHVNWGDARLVK